MNWLSNILSSTSRGAAVSPGAEAWMVFGMRLLLSVSALLTLYVGHDGVALLGRWGWLVFIAYALHSLTLFGVARLRAGFWHGPVVYWLDIGWYGLMVYATGGAPTPFFTFFFFAILAASFRYGFDAGARLTLGSTVIVVLTVTATQGLHAVQLLLLRATFVLALGYMIAFWGGLLVDQRRRLALLRDVSRLSNPRFGVQHTLDSLMDKILRFYGAHACVLLMQDGAGRWTLTTARQGDGAPSFNRAQTDAEIVQPLLELGHGAAIYDAGGRRFLPRRPSAVRLARDARDWALADVGACARIADLLDTDAFISASLPLRKGAGRIFVTGSRLRRGDATFLKHIVQQAFPVIETIDLLDRLASDAAFRERQTIARDLHDSTIQPYIGLRAAVAAVRLRAGDANPVAADLDRLTAMCTDVVKDMREFAQRFKHGRQEEPELLIALRRQLNQVRNFYDVDVALDAAAAPAINDRMAAQVFQVVTEGISNVCKHTHARRARVLLAEAGGQLAIDIANPCEGAACGDFMPVSIAERVAALGGTLAVAFDAAARETVLRIRVPV